MPTYDYKCNACRHRFELFQSMTDSPKRKCPECGRNALERLIGTGAALIFKGSGFYQTDYRSESYKKAAAAEKKPGADAKAQAKDGEGKAEAKPASEAKPAAGEPKAKSQGATKRRSKPKVD
jgi:putative FmdB family regulatory protein